jgi:hypothetical protein
MNMGTDRKADALTTFFCGTDLGRQLIDENEVDLRLGADRIMTAIK